MEPPAMGDAVRLVAEALREHISEVCEHTGLQKIGMNLGDAVRTVRPDDRQVRHPDRPRRRFLDEAHATAPIGVSWIPIVDVTEKAPIDLVDDFEVTWH